MSERTTIQDIADAIGMSRNTVSKALNGKYVPDSTRNKVINAAIELGYKGYDMLVSNSDFKRENRRILVLSSQLLMNIDYYIYVLRGIQQKLSETGDELIQFSIKNVSSFNRLKEFLANNTIDGIICIEFFELEYVIQLLELNIPLVFLDFPFSKQIINGNFDVLLPESRYAVMDLCTQLIENDRIKTFGFVGDPKHCMSFYERFSGMNEALNLAHIHNDYRYSIIYEDSNPYSAHYLFDKLNKLEELPQCFIAANDFIANNLLIALKNMDIKVPQEVKVVGFDNTPLAKKTRPLLTTFHVNKNSLGKELVSILNKRIKNPLKSNSIIHVKSNLIIRAST